MQAEGEISASGPPGVWGSLWAARPPLWHLTVFFAAYLAAGGVCQGLLIVPGVQLSVWPPGGIFVAALLLTRTRSWPWWMLSGGLAELTCNAVWFHNPVHLACVYFGGNAAEAATAAWLIRRLTGGQFRLESPREVAAFVLGAVAAPVVGATVIATTDAAIGRHPFAVAWPMAWLGDATGLLVFTPLGVVLAQAWRERERIPAARWAEAGVLVLVLLGVGVLAFAGVLPTPYTVLPPLLWAAVRFQLKGGAAALAVVTLVAAAFSASRQGDFAGNADLMHDKLVQLQTFLVLAAVSTLIVATLSRLHREAATRLRAANAELEGRVAERTADLGRERERLAVALRAGRLGVYEWDVTANTVWWSRETYPVYGVAPDAFTPTSEAFLALVHPDDRAELWRKTEDSLSRGEVFTHEYRIVRPDGGVRWVYNRSHVGERADGRRVVTGVAVDVTEARLAGEALKEADRRKDEFLATLSHELRNPLAPVRNAVKVLALRENSPADVRWARELIERQVRDMARLIDDLMDVSRINRGKLELKRERVALGEVLSRSVEACRPMVEEMGHTLTVCLPPEPVTLDADPTRLTQVFLNLLNNAAKYTERGGVIELRAEADGGEVAVRVLDTGIGIPADHLPGLFELFSQVEAARSRSRGGLGIGLSLVKRLVELHGGTVSARSDGPGRGSEFTVRLPVAAAAPPAAPPASTNGSPQGLRVLVVDDNVDAADSLALLLELTGSVVRTAYDGERALAVAAEFRPRVVLCDIGLPKLDGYEVCRRLRGQGWAADTVLVAVSGWGQDGDKRKAGDAGFAHHLTKPVDPQVLLALLSDLRPPHAG